MEGDRAVVKKPPIKIYTWESIMWVCKTLKPNWEDITRPNNAMNLGTADNIVGNDLSNYSTTHKP